MTKAVFFDRDGTLIVEQHYLKDPEKVILFDDAVTALRGIMNAGFELFIVTNQSGIARGYFTEVEYQAVHRRVCERFAAGGVTFRDAAFCPHAPDSDCSCRKPNPGMLTTLMERHHIDPRVSFMVGDKAADIEAGIAAGVTSILVMTGYGRDDLRKLAGKQFIPADNLGAVRDIILGGANEK
ncbi:MAG: HAD family hydrolase [Spirochaetes bacterium]|nr:HAD family hydrolase [Spirochaetota bacterium]